MHLSEIDEALRLLEAEKRLRLPDDRRLRAQMEEAFGPDFLDAASNDYLGLARGGADSDSGKLSAPGVKRVSESEGPQTQELAEKGGQAEANVSRETPSMVSGASSVSRETDNQSAGSETEEASGAHTSLVSAPSLGAGHESSSLAESSFDVASPRPSPGSQLAQEQKAFKETQADSAPCDGIELAPGKQGAEGAESSTFSGLGIPTGKPIEQSGAAIENQFSGEDASGRTRALSEKAQVEGASSVQREASLSGSASPGPRPISSSGFGAPPIASASDSTPQRLSSEQVEGEEPTASAQGRAKSYSSRRQHGLVSVSRETESAPSLGAGSSRLIYGTHSQHLQLEREVASWLQMPAALFFASGYAANVGSLSALLSRDDAVFSDALNHASLIDGIRLSRAHAQVFRHLDLGHLEELLQAHQSAPARWVIVESYYSMDGDGPDLVALRSLCDRYSAHLYVDEAHSVGTFGKAGSGLCSLAGIQPDILMAAFGKAVGSQGACVLGSDSIRTWLWNRARSFVFSTAPSPLLAQSVLDQVRRTQRAENERVQLADRSRLFRALLEKRNLPLVPHSFGPVVGLLLGQESRALKLASALRGRGILAQAIRPPTVPVGESRVRLVLRSSLALAQVQHLADVVARETENL